MRVSVNDLKNLLNTLDGNATISIGIYDYGCMGDDDAYYGLFVDDKLIVKDDSIKGTILA